MKIFFFPSMFLFFGVLILPVGSRLRFTIPGTIPTGLTTICIPNLRILEMKATSSPISKSKQLEKKEFSTANRIQIPTEINWWQACLYIGGQCRPQCGNKEFRLSFCESPKFACCLRECDPNNKV
nr:beta-defensin 112 [Oryctolagus cuniculus]